MTAKFVSTPVPKGNARHAVGALYTYPYSSNDIHILLGTYEGFVSLTNPQKTWSKAIGDGTATGLIRLPTGTQAEVTSDI